MRYKLVKDNLEGFAGEARLYELSEPIAYTDVEDEEERNGETRYVVASAVIAPFTGAETLVFPADKDGNILSWLDIGGVRALDHDAAMEDMVWRIENKEDEDER